MDELILDGSHFMAVLHAAEHILSSKHKLEDVELIYDNVEKLYVLRVHKAGENEEILTTFPS